MKTLPLLLLLATSLTLSAQTEEKLDKKFSIPAGGQLVVDVGAGSIDVTTHASDEVTVSVYRKVNRRSKADEEEFLREHPVTFSQDGSKLTIHTDDRNNGMGGWFSSNRSEAKYTITVPASFNLQLKTSGGGIGVNEVTGNVTANTSGGGLKFAHVHGPIDGHTSGGGIHVEGCEGNIKINTSGGGIHVAGGGGNLDGDTSGGSVTVKEFHGPARVETSGGGITLENITGKVDGSTSGGSINALFSSPLVEEVKLETSGGGVTVRLPGDSAFTLDAATSGGDVSTDLPVTVVGKLSRSHLSGPVNGGGKILRLRSSGGGIHVKKL